MPGFRLNVNGSTKHFQCTLCHLLLKSPVQTVCGHRCCYSCVKEKRGSSDHFICPEDNVEVKEVFPDKFVEREILTLTGTCENIASGCPWNGQVKEYEEHILQCEYVSVKCSNEGCDELIPRSYLEKHMKTECQYRKEPCNLCQEMIIVAQLKKHYQTTCPETKIKCTQCGRDVLRGQLSVHEESDCAEAIIACPFAKIGCAAKRPMKKNDKRKHMENAQTNHITYLLNFSLDIAQKVNEIKEQSLRRDDISYQEVELSTMKETAAQLKMMCDSFSVSLPLAEDLSRGKEPGNKRGKIVADSTPTASASQYSSLPSDAKRLSDYGAFDGGTMKDMNKQISNLDSRITALSLQFADVQESVQAYVNEMKKSNRNVDALRDSIRKMEQKFGNFEDLQQKTAVNMAEQNDRIDDLENANFDGTLIWPITNLSKKRHDSIIGRNVSFYSPYFYSSQYGYKMRLRIYLNGDGIGKGSHISLFFVVCKGKYDGLLPWPFRAKVTMSILDQDHVKHVSDSFKPDPTSSSFQRPKNAMNIASGCPLFMALSFLDTHAYTRDNTLYVKAEVDTSGLPRS